MTHRTIYGSIDPRGELTRMPRALSSANGRNICDGLGRASGRRRSDLVLCELCEHLAIVLAKSRGHDHGRPFAIEQHRNARQAYFAKCRVMQRFEEVDRGKVLVINQRVKREHRRCRNSDTSTGRWVSSDLQCTPCCHLRCRCFGWNGPPSISDRASRLRWRSSNASGREILMSASSGPRGSTSATSTSRSCCARK